MQRLYIARDGDTAGTRAAERLRQRAEAAGILDVRDLYPMHGDFNDDLRRLGAAWLAGHVAVQLDPAVSAGSAPMHPARRRGRPDGP